MNFSLKLSILLFFLFLSIDCFSQSDGSVSEESSIGKALKDVALDEVSDIKKSYVGDRKNGFFYGFREDSKTLIPFEYEELPELLAPLMRAKKNKKYGIISSKNEVIVPFIYDELPYTLSDFMIVKAGEKKGLITLKGQVVIPVEYNEVYLIPFKNNTYIAVNQDNLSEFDTEGNMKKSTFTYFKNYSYKKFISIGNASGKYGLVDYENKELIPFVYDCPLVDFRTIDGVYQWKTCKNQKYGIVDLNQKLILAFDYEDVKKTFFTSWFQISEGDKVGIVDETGKTIVPSKYDKAIAVAFNRARGRRVVVVKDSLKGVYDERGVIIIPLEYDYVKLIKNRFFKVGKEKKFGIFDLYGELILPCEFEKDIRFKNEILTANRRFKRSGRYTPQGEIIPAKKFEFEERLNDYLVVSNSNEAGAKKGLVDNVGNLIVEPIYDSFRLQNFEHLGFNFFIFEHDGKFAFSVDNLVPKIQPLTKFAYDNLAFGIYKKDGKKLIGKGHDLNDIIGYSLSPNGKERTYITINMKEILIK